MADKMWDILRFLKNPENEGLKDEGSSPTAAAEKKQINAQLIDALERTEAAIDEAIGAPDQGPRPAAAPAVAAATSPAAAPPLAKREPEPGAAASPQLATRAAGVEHKKAVSAPTADTAVPSSPPTAEEKKPKPVQKPKTAKDEAPLEEERGGQSERLLKIPLAKIKPNPFQPRKVMGENEIMELSDSIKELGVLQPILVKELRDGYELIAGERRMRAAQRAGLTEIPAMVVEVEPVAQQVIALVENIQRKNLTAIEEALCLHDIISKTGWSQMELSRRMWRSQASIANKLRLLRLDDSVQELVISGKLGERQARSLLSLSMEEQRALAQKAIDEELSARALEALAENWNGRAKAPRKQEAKRERDSADGPAGDLLGDLSALITRHRNQGVSAQWKVRQMNQSSLVIEIAVDLKKTQGGDASL